MAKKREKSKVHWIAVKVSFDRPVDAGKAAKAFKNNIHGIFYPELDEADGAETFKILAARAAAV